MGERIGILGGTFDPVHNGHIAIAQSFLDSGYIDELWILPSPDPPHKQETPLTDIDLRKRMLELAFSGTENVVISNLENRLPRPSYTIRTLEFLKQEHPDTSFYLCIGEDSLSEFDTWYQPERILEEFELLVARRPGFDAGDSGLDFDGRAHMIEHDPVPISSTEIRDRIARGEDAGALIPERVLQFIHNHELYRQ